MTIEQPIEELRAELKSVCDTIERRELEAELELAQAELAVMLAAQGGVIETEPPSEAGSPVSPRRRRCRQSLLVQGILQGLSRRERELLCRRHFDHRAGPRIARFALRRILHLELAEAGDGGFSTGSRGSRDCSEHGFNDCLALRFGQTLFACDLVGDFIRCCHLRSPC